jgi:uncharacterized NAD(P)/FAD-binding protein YdhS
MYTVAIVGAGFSGMAVAAQLLRRLRGPARVLLLNRHSRFGRGLAYGTHSGSHLLNVPAGRMGMDPQDEGGFARYLAALGLPYAASDFVPRILYGAYLEHSLQVAQHEAAPGVRLELMEAAVERLSPVAAGGWRLGLGHGLELDADQVVLALGNFTPQPPASLRELQWGPPPLVADPWTPPATIGLAQDATVLLIGSGLTAYDVALQLMERGHTGPVLMLSRRGLLPQSHRQQEAPPARNWADDSFMSGESRPQRMLRTLRRRIDEAAAAGADWRDVVGSLRPHTARLWQQLDARGRSQFLRHLLPFWDTHRHRAAPAIDRLIQGSIERGQLRPLAGRLLRLHPAAAGLQAEWQPRGQAQTQWLTVARVINCTGPSSDLRRVADSLIRQLLADGHLHPDGFGLGVRVDAGYRTGEPGTATLHYVGPLLKAQHWEATAVPELRQHALQLALQLVSHQPPNERQP